MRGAPDVHPDADVTVAVIGSGFAGLGMARQLQLAGIDFAVFERSSELGGTWRDNTYPGCACDVPSHLYSYSFALNPDWSHTFARQPEIQAYLRSCSERWGLRDAIRFGVDVARASWQEEQACWQLETSDGVVRARFVVFAVGALRLPRFPAIEGLSDFAGPSMHSAEWDPSVELRGKRVAVIGTGASAIQIVPSIADEAGSVTVFQRTAPWVQPRWDRRYSGAEKQRLRRQPWRMRLRRWSLYARLESFFFLAFGRWRPAARLAEALNRWWIGTQIDDPELLDAVTPRFSMGCKRVLVSSDWYPTLARPDVRLRTEPIERVTASGLVVDGEELPFDVLIHCTGFDLDRLIGHLDVRGVGGRDLVGEWGDRPVAHLGIEVAGYPNAFLLLGPNTALGHNSVLIMVEAQCGYVLQALRHTLERGPRAWSSVRESVQRAFVAWVDRRHRDLVWASGCASWYLGRGGANFTIWPGGTLSYRARTRRWRPDEHDLG